jgi:hypothetical protein
MKFLSRSARTKLSKWSRCFQVFFPKVEPNDLSASTFFLQNRNDLSSSTLFGREPNDLSASTYFRRQEVWKAETNKTCVSVHLPCTWSSMIYFLCQNFCHLNNDWFLCVFVFVTKRYCYLRAGVIETEKSGHVRHVWQVLVAKPKIGHFCHFRADMSW